jgi:shikimate kinase
MARLVLVGLPGVGKTTMAALLAREWHCVALDTDELLAAAQGVDAPQYLRSAGVTAFRNAELEALQSAISQDSVVSTGGGVVTTASARELLKEQVTLWLDCADDVLTARLAVGDRPLLGEDVGASLAQLRLERASFYEEVARARIDASGKPHEVAQRVHETLSEVRP